MWKLISLLLVFILIFSFAGCGVNIEPEKDNQLTENTDRTENISKTDSPNSIKEKFGNPDYENEDKLISHYSLPNIKIADDIFGITFFFNDNGNGIKNVQLGYFGNLYKQ